MQPYQIRIDPEGKTELWDDGILGWRAPTALDKPYLPKVIDPRKKFVCGNCGANVNKITNFAGWEAATIDPETGEEDGVYDSGWDEVHDEEYRCTPGCGWTAGYDWAEEIRDGKEEKVEEENPPRPEPRLTLYQFAPANPFLGEQDPF